MSVLQFLDAYQRIAGWALAWDSIILTGGGSALLHNKLMPILNHSNIILADKLDNLLLSQVAEPKTPRPMDANGVS